MAKTLEIEFRVLHFINANAPVTSIQIAQALNIDSQEMLDILREGARHNFIKREYDEDNRCIVYLLGSRGRHAIEEAQIAEQIKRRDPDLLLERIAELETQLALANSALRASMQLNEELINDSGEDESPGKFMVSVDGASSPRHIHNSEEEARVEAMRLAELATNVTKPVRVLKLVDTLIVSTSTVKTAQWSSELGENEAPANCTEQCGHCKEQCRA